MKIIFLLATVFLLFACASEKPKEKKVIIDKKTLGLLPTEKQPDLVEVTQFKGVQVTGVTVTPEGRIFANFPRWRENVPFSVVEVMPDGTHRPYPDDSWNTWHGKPVDNSFTCVQSVFAHKNHLYVLDPSSPLMKGVVGKAKLYRFELTTNKLDKTWTFDQEVAPENSYLNDFRIDDQEQKIFITDSGLGGIVVLDMKSGEAKRLLDKHPSTKSENVTLTVDKTEWKKQIHSDGIAISPVDNKLYYHALTGYTLYRVPTEALATDLRDETKLVKQVEKLGVTPAPDGMTFDKHGNLYMADLERNAVSYRTPEGEMKILIQDERIKWPDTLTIDNENHLVFTDSLLQAAGPGKAVDDMTFKIYRVSLPAIEAQEESKQSY
jgi:sugar lactone lactonase YvrE